jgi:hypothetical protein
LQVPWSSSIAVMWWHLFCLDRRSSGWVMAGRLCRWSLSKIQQQQALLWKQETTAHN